MQLEFDGTIDDVSAPPTKNFRPKDGPCTMHHMGMQLAGVDALQGVTRDNICCRKRSTPAIVKNTHKSDLFVQQFREVGQMDLCIGIHKG
eukprot:10214337-Ditylum_brightwellii.AAC.1